MCNPFAIKSIGFWDYLISDQPCSTVTWNSHEEGMIWLVLKIILILGIVITLHKLTTKLDAYIPK